MQRLLKQNGSGGGVQGGTGPGLQLEQSMLAALERLVTSESALPYQTVMYEQPCSHAFTASTVLHSLLLAQPEAYFLIISVRSAEYVCLPI